MVARRYEIYRVEFECSTRYLTRSLRSLVRYRFEHEKILKMLSGSHTNVSEHFPKISENFRRFPKISEDCRGRSEDVST